MLENEFSNIRNSISNINNSFSNIDLNIVNCKFSVVASIFNVYAMWTPNNVFDGNGEGSRVLLTVVSPWVCILHRVCVTYVIPFCPFCLLSFIHLFRIVLSHIVWSSRHASFCTKVCPKSVIRQVVGATCQNDSSWRYIWRSTICIGTKESKVSRCESNVGALQVIILLDTSAINCPIIRARINMSVWTQVTLPVTRLIPVTLKFIF